MPSLKRKRTHRERSGSVDPTRPNPSLTVTRSATRQHASTTPHPVLPDPEPRRRRRRVDTEDQQPSQAGAGIDIAGGVARGKENIPMQTAQNATQKPTRTTRHSGLVPSELALGGARLGSSTSAGSNNQHARLIQAPTIPAPASPAAPPTRASMPTRHNTPSLKSHTYTAGHSKPLTMAMSSSHASSAQGHHHRHQPSTPSGIKSSNSDRNIDKVVLGNVCFRAWYPSYYGKEVLGDASAAGSSFKVASGNGLPTGDGKDDIGHKTQTRRGDSQPVLDRLYVCPCCFKYSKELVAWWEHVRSCERKGFVPGAKIYVHPKGTRTKFVDPGPAYKHLRGKRGSTGLRMVEETVHDDGEWSIWEVDGEKEVLFCQNLSLFAKLFLDNKSVFFDVTGFNYFLLVYTRPSTPPDPNAEVATIDPPQHRIVGFFSKEKMSWDNNNLACILIFPPWQRKGLGSLLMGVSYEISKREGILGGPEKPISDLGKKGYKRFWAGEIARWLLTLEPAGMVNETIVDVEECSRATWITAEDCLLVLREMGLAEDAGTGPPRIKRLSVEDGEGEPEESQVRRVRISKPALRNYIEEAKINLAKTCDPQGFVDGYACAKRVTVDEDN